MPVRRYVVGRILHPEQTRIGRDTKATQRHVPVWLACVRWLLPAQRIVMAQRHPSGPPMTLCNVRHLGVHRLVAYCLNPSCRHEGRIDVSKFADHLEARLFVGRVARNEGARGRPH